MSKTIIRRGSIFDLGDIDLPQLASLLRRIDAEHPRALLIYQAIIDCAQDDPERRTDMVSVCEQANVTGNQVTYRMGQLVKTGYLKKGYATPSEEERALKKKKCVLYTLLNPIENAPVAHHEQAQQLPAQQIQEQLHFHLGNHIPAAIPWKGERFSIFTLLATFRLGTKVSKTSENRMVPIHIGSHRFDVEVTTEVGRAPLGILDVRVLIAVFSLIHQHKQRKSLPKNGELAILLKDIIARLPGWDDCGARRRQVLAALQRAESTGFMIRNDGSFLADRFNGQVTLNEKFRLITKIRWVSVKAGNSEIPEAVALHLDDDLYNRLTSEDAAYLLAIHDEALAEKNAFTLMFYLWCRRAIGHHGGKFHPWSLEHLNKEICPLSSRGKFLGMLLDMIERHNDKGTVNIHGYKINYEVDEKRAWIWPDEKDPLIGKNSYRALQSSS